MRHVDPARKIFNLIFLFLSWLVSQEYLIADLNSHLPIHYFRQLALDLKLIVGQANLQLRPATCAHSPTTTFHKLSLVHQSHFMSQAC